MLLAPFVPYVPPPIIRSPDGGTGPDMTVGEFAIGAAFILVLGVAIGLLLVWLASRDS